MTIDERLERLTERHEALTQSVELISTDIAQVSKDIGKLGSDMKQAESLLVRMADGLATLSRIAQRHEERLDRLEGEA